MKNKKNCVYRWIDISDVVEDLVSVDSDTMKVTKDLTLQPDYV